MSEGPIHIDQMARDCGTLLGRLPGATSVEIRADGLWMAAPSLDVLAMAELMRRLGARLTTLTGVALDGGETGVLYHYCLGPLRINLKAETRDRAIPSITPVARAADWSEREIGDLYGVRFEGHPNLTRLIRPPALPPGFFRDPDAGGSRG
jgi:NADH:ubiquinone oxidoreductase subunit C